MINASFKIEALEEEKDYGKFVFEPLQQGFGHTVGNALRRTLLSSLRGAAVEKIRIDGVKHPFSTIEGVTEDMVQILLNIKQLNVQYDPEDEDEEKPVMEFSVKGPGKFTAKDIEAPSGVKVINKDLEIATLADKKTELKGEMTVGTGTGYSAAEERETESIGEISVDATYAPVVRVNYKVEATRVGRRTDLDKLIMEVWTNGSIKPKAAIEQAAQILEGFFKQVYEPVFEEKEEEKEERPENYETLALTVEELNLPTRIVNALRRGGYKTVKDLVAAEEEEVKKVKNIGKKSLSVVKERLEEKGVGFKDEA
jgi:DNA-directed RNA polymerase subunit alpha